MRQALAGCGKTRRSNEAPRNVCGVSALRKGLCALAAHELYFSSLLDSESEAAPRTASPVPYCQTDPPGDQNNADDDADRNRFAGKRGTNQHGGDGG